MENKNVSPGKPWTKPELRVLAPTDECIRAAGHKNPAFATALRRCREKVEGADLLAR